MTLIPPDVRRALGSYQQLLRARFGERLEVFRLFGSYARGDARPDSDIDVAVAIRGMSRPEWRDAIDLAVDVELEQQTVLSPWVVSAERFEELRAREIRIALDVLSEGIQP